MVLPKATYNKYICQKTEEEQRISAGTVRMLIKTRANNNSHWVNPIPSFNTTARIRHYTMLSAIIKYQENRQKGRVKG